VQLIEQITSLFTIGLNGCIAVQFMFVYLLLEWSQYSLCCLPL